MLLLYKIYHRADHLLRKYLHYFVTTRNTRASAAMCELALEIGRTDLFSLSRLPIVVRLWNLLSLNGFSGGSLGSFKSAINSCQQ